jgi:putative endonuclease
MAGQFYVYIMTNRNNTTLYTGMTNDLRRRAFEHRSCLGGTFAAKYKTVKLVYFEVFDSAWNAIRREKQIKAGSRQKKIDLIDRMNPRWRDLYDSL